MLAVCALAAAAARAPKRDTLPIDHKARIATYSRTRYIFGDTSATISPAMFGGDPTGVNDSTRAVLQCVQECQNRITPRRYSEGSPDYGGCTIDLEGGEYLISHPLSIFSPASNLRITRGTLVASASFPPDEFLVVIGARNASQPCSNTQNACSMNIGMEGLSLDGAHVANGVQINQVMGCTVGPQAYVLNFTQYGIQVNGGHEVMVDETWVGQYNWADRGPAYPLTATGIALNSFDHFVHNTIVFAAAVGVHVGAAANLLSGVHTWSSGQYGIHVAAAQTRMVGCYLDYVDLRIDAGEVEFVDGFFLEAAVEVQAGANKEVHSLRIADSEIIRVRGGGDLVRWPAGVTPVDVAVVGNLFGPGVKAQTSEATRTVAMARGAVATFDFCGVLSPPRIQRVLSAAVVSDDAAARTFLVPTAAIGACSFNVTAAATMTVTLTVSSSASSY